MRKIELVESDHTPSHRQYPALFLRLTYKNGKLVGIGFTIGSSFPDEPYELILKEVYNALKEKAESDKVPLTMSEKNLVKKILDAYMLGYKRGRTYGNLSRM